MSKKILLIESDSAFAEELSEALERHGLEVRVTGEGKDGLDLARAAQPDAIVLSVELPKMSGYSVCNKLKKDDDLKAIPLIIVSAEATPETFEQHKRLKTRAEEYLLKPFRPGELIEKLGQLIELPAAEAVGTGDVVPLEDVDIEALDTSTKPPSEKKRSPVAPTDDDLKLLDEAFENITTERPLPADAANAIPVPERAPEPLLPPPPAVHAAPLEPQIEIERLGAEADEVLKALRSADADVASAAAHLDAKVGTEGVEPSMEEIGTGSRPLLSRTDIHRLQDTLAKRNEELERATAQIGALEAEVSGHRSRISRLDEEARRAEEEHGRKMQEAAARAEEVFRVARDEARRAEERCRSLEQDMKLLQDRVDRAEQARRDAESAQRDIEQEIARRVEAAEQLASTRANEAQQALARAADLARIVDEATVRTTEQEKSAQAIRMELSSARAEADKARLDSDRRIAELQRKIVDLEGQIAKHEERVVKAYLKIKGDEKIREKARKALGIALQLLDEQAAAAASEGQQPPQTRRE